MPNIAPLSYIEQVAHHLRGEISRGVWPKEVPGAPKLARELGVDPKTVLAALKLLEQENLLISQGIGKRRRINPNIANIKDTQPLRIAILPHDQHDHRVDYIMELQDGLTMAGHHAYYASKTVQDFGSDLSRLASFVKAQEADAWVVVSGSKDLLRWFADCPYPSFALFGRFSDLPIAATMPEKIPAYEMLVDRLVELGHRRISLLVREDRRVPLPGRTERVVLERIKYHGITTSSYNLPEWKDGKLGFQVMLTKLFQLTPPTALITQEAFVFSAAYHFLALRGLHVPRDVSLACSNDDSTFSWCEPTVSHIYWDSKLITRRVVKWAANVTRGKKDIGQRLTKAKLVEGNTIGPAPEIRKRMPGVRPSTSKSKSATYPSNG